MKREYMKPSMRVVVLRSKPLLQAVSNGDVNRNASMNVEYGEQTI